MEKIDYKKEYREIYLPKTKPMVIDIPGMKYIMVEGKGNPNKENGEYKEAISVLYGLSYIIKMSKLGKNKIDGYFDYIVPPLEGLWWQDDINSICYEHKEEFKWISMIRQPEFVTGKVFNWACKELENKKGYNVSKAEFKEFSEGLCVQIMHRGSYDEEPKTLKLIEEYMKDNMLKSDIGAKTKNGMIRRHHEIYLSDPRKTNVNNLKTVIRVPVTKGG